MIRFGDLREQPSVVFNSPVVCAIVVLWPFVSMMTPLPRNRSSLVMSRGLVANRWASGVVVSHLVSIEEVRGSIPCLSKPPPCIMNANPHISHLAFGQEHPWPHHPTHGQATKTKKEISETGFSVTGGNTGSRTGHRVQELCCRSVELKNKCKTYLNTI